MGEPTGKRHTKEGLNPDLKAREDTTHGTSHSTPPPTKSVSVQREEGRGWPITWAIVTIVGVLIVVWILFL